MAEARLLLIDDDAAFRRLVTRVGVMAGYEVRATGDATEFKKDALAWLPSLIITDLNMPEMDGIELLRELAVGKCTAPIVVASGIDGRTLDASLRLGVERGLRMDGVLQKPVSVAALQQLLLRHKPMDDRGAAR